MAKNKTYTVPYNRKKKGRTNYNKRLKYLISGKPRIVIRKSLKTISIQLVEYTEKGDKILNNVKSSDLKKYGWNFNLGNIPSAYLTGLLFAKNAKVKEGVVDLGFVSVTKGSRITAAIKGLVDGGMKIKYSEKIFPKEEAIKGDHLKSKDEKHFEEVKVKILK